MQAFSFDYNQAFYRYDAGGERDLKLTGTVVDMWQNGSWGNIAMYEQTTLYASPLMTVSESGYTKHYFAEGERIASATGRGGTPLIDPNYQPAAAIEHFCKNNQSYTIRKRKNKGRVYYLQKYMSLTIIQ